MAIAITAPNGNRIEYGGYNTGFGYVDAGSWPSSWNTTADGNFTATVTGLDQWRPERFRMLARRNHERLDQRCCKRLRDGPRPHWPLRFRRL